MSEREREHQGEEGGGEGEDRQEKARRSVRIPGRDFAGTNIAGTEEQQTADHRGEDRSYVLDDVQATDAERGDIPRDES